MDLKKFRENNEHGMVEADGKCLSTLSREELLEIAKGVSFNVEDIIMLGRIEVSLENICKLIHFALESKEGDVNI